eukprot:2681904-Amphidinium_carterae.1
MVPKLLKLPGVLPCARLGIVQLGMTPWGILVSSSWSDAFRSWQGSEQLRDVAGDGNCFWHALAMLMQGKWRLQAAVRHA